MIYPNFNKNFNVKSEESIFFLVESLYMSFMTTQVVEELLTDVVCFERSYNVVGHRLTGKFTARLELSSRNMVLYGNVAVQNGEDASFPFFISLRLKRLADFFLVRFGFNVKEWISSFQYNELYKH